MKTRIEHDLLGEKEVPADAYYGIQTLRGIENFQNISGITIGDYPNYVKALAMVKWAAAKANQELEILPDDIANAITRACEEIIGGKLHDQFPVDLIQGGAVGNQSVPGYRSVSRLDAGHAAEGARLTDRAAGVGTERIAALFRCNRRAGTA